MTRTLYYRKDKRHNHIHAAHNIMFVCLFRSFYIMYMIIVNVSEIIVICEFVVGYVLGFVYYIINYIIILSFRTK